MVLGLGLIVMEADNDAKTVSTSIQANGEYCLHLPWRLAFLLPTWDLIQERMNRLGIATLRRLMSGSVNGGVAKS